MTQHHTRRRWPIALALLGLSYLVAVVFYPVLGFSFISLDVNRQLVDNPHVHGLTAQNIQHILTSHCIASYYPVRSLTLALDYEIWGLDPTGFKLTGGLIHLVNVLLVFWLVVRLFRHPFKTKELAERQEPLDIGELAVATFSAGLFAIHPVVVEPVTWVAGREELLMTLGALGCIHFHISARYLLAKGGRSDRVMACFVGAAICCIFGCLSNAMGAVIPLLITAWDALTLLRPKLGRILRGTFALWLIGAATVVIKVLGPTGPQVEMPWSLLARQPGVVLAGYWLNLKTLVWPTNLSLSYEYIWPDNLPLAQVVLGAIAVVATFILLWCVRRRTRLLFGILWFCLALAPTSQLLPHHLQRADRFLYLPLVGLAVAVAIALGQARRFIRGPAAVTATAVAGLGMLWLLVWLSTHQVQKWQNDLTLWEHGVTAAPNNPRTHAYLGDAYHDAGVPDRARASFQRAIDLEPNYVFALNEFAICLTSDSAPRLQDHLLAVELAERGCLLTEWRALDLVHTLARAQTTLANTLNANGQYKLAIDYYNEAIKTNPKYDMAPFNLALVLSTCPDEDLRNPQKAVEMAERGRQLVDSLDVHRLSILAAAYSEAGQFDDAIAVTEEAIAAAWAAEDVTVWERLNENIQRFKKGMPLPTLTQEINEQARKLAERLTADFPNNPDSHHVAADVSYWQGDSEKAVKSWEKCLELEPRYAYAHHGIGKVAAKKGQHEQAVSAFREALKLGQAPVDTQVELAWALIHTGELAEAIETINKSLETGPPSGRAFFLLGTAHEQLQDYEKAKDAYRQAINLLPGLAEAYYGMANVCRRLGQSDEAEEFLKRHKELTEGDRRRLQTLRSSYNDVEDMRRLLASNYLNAARIYRANNNLRETEKLLQNAASLDPANAEARQGLAWLYNQQGRIVEAIRILEELAVIEPENPTYYLEIGRLHKNAKRAEAAAEAFEKAARISSRRAPGPSGTGFATPTGKPKTDAGGIGPGKE